MFLKSFYMSGTASSVDVLAVGIIGDHIGIGSEHGEHVLGDRPCSTVGTVKTDLITSEAVLGDGCEMTYV